jgi:hypothetical protein
MEKEFIQENTYYGVPVPWLQVKLLQVIQLFPPTGLFDLVTSFS